MFNIHNVTKVSLLLSAAVLTVGCAGGPASFGDRAMADSRMSAAIAKDWEAGKDELERGNKLVERGQNLVRKGEADVSRGDALIAEGSNALAAARAEYQAFVNQPRSPEDAAAVAAEAETLREIVSRWEAAEKQIRKGGDLIGRGNERIAEGEALLRKGEPLVKAGREAMDDAEKRYRQGG